MGAANLSLFDEFYVVVVTIFVQKEKGKKKRKDCWVLPTLALS
jgi:hypothetical protein